MLEPGIYDFVICRGGTDMCFVLGFGRKRPDLKQYRISGLTSHPPNPLSIFLIFCRDNHYRCSYLSESRTMTAVRSTSNIGACPVVPPTRAVTDKVNRLLTLSLVCSEELDFRTTGNLSATSKDQTHDGIRLSCGSDTIPARAPLGHPTPYLQGHQSVQVPTNK